MTETIQSEPKVRSHEEMYSFLEIGTKEVFSLMLGENSRRGRNRTRSRERHLPLWWGWRATFVG